jgi:hypothetical protein
MYVLCIVISRSDKDLQINNIRETFTYTRVRTHVLASIESTHSYYAYPRMHTLLLKSSLVCRAHTTVVLQRV